jgi:hypothetical protein
MNYRPILEKVKKSEMAPLEAYDMLYQSEVKTKAAHFIKMKINVKESKLATFVCGTLFLVPTPVIIARMLIRMFRKKIPLGQEDYRLLIRAISEAGGSQIKIHNPDADILLRLF